MQISNNHHQPSDEPVTTIVFFGTGYILGRLMVNNVSWWHIWCLMMGWWTTILEAIMIDYHIYHHLVVSNHHSPLFRSLGNLRYKSRIGKPSLNGVDRNHATSLLQRVILTTNRRHTTGMIPTSAWRRSRSRGLLANQFTGPLQTIYRDCMQIISQKLGHFQNNDPSY